MPKVTITLDDETQFFVEEIRKLSTDALRAKPDAEQVLLAALKLGLRKDVATLRRATTLQQRWV